MKKSRGLALRIFTFLCAIGMIMNSGVVYAQGGGTDEAQANTAPSITLTEPQQNIVVTQGDKISIVWEDEDPDDNAMIDIAYDVDNDPVNEENYHWIIQGLSEDLDGDGDRYEWDTTGVAAGTYYVWAAIGDSTNAPVYALAAGTVTIQEVQVPTEEPTSEPPQAPIEEPTQVPTEEPTAAPIEEPTIEPTAVPIEEPTTEPTQEPGNVPTYEDAPHLSNDGLTLYNGVMPLLVMVDSNQEMKGVKIPQDSAVAAAIADPSAASATFSITYAAAGATDPWGAVCQTFPSGAKTAFNAAAAIWANTIQSSVPITIFACWSNLGSSSILGYSGGQPLHRDFSGAPQANTWYQGALANSLYGSDLASSSYDDYITYNSNFTWYYGTDGNPTAGTYDLVTVATHEIGHGLNFSGTASYSSGTGYYKSSGYPSIYDTFMEDASGNKLSSYTNPSTSLGSLFTSNNLWFDGTNADAANGGSRVKMYAPSTWSSGSSYSHLDYSTFAGTANSLMVYAVSSGSAQHNPGAVTKGLMKDLGWAMASATPTPISPSGTITDTTPTYTWSKISGATKYQYQLYKGSTLVYATTVSSSVCGTTNCTATPTTVLSGGDYKWRVGSYVGSWQAFSAYKTFTVSVPVTPTPNSPSGTITDTTPTYTWSKISGATKYQYQLYRGSTLVYSKTVTSSVCGTSSCTSTPSNVLGAGAYQWRVGAYVSGAWKTFSSYKSFTVYVPVTPTPNSPSGTITDSTPTYTWSKISGATKYQYQLYKGSTLVYSKTVTSSVCGTSSCTSTPSNVLGAGAYQWRVGAYVSGAWKTFSSFKTFNLTFTPTPGSPSGSIMDTTPTYTWTKISAATKYMYQLFKGSTLVYSKTVSTSVCGTSSCTSTPANVLSAGDYKWRIGAYVSGAWRSFSSYKTFTVISGFNSQFTSDAAGWAPVKGTWTVGSGYYKSPGISGMYSSTAYNKLFPTFTYEVRIKRNGCTDCATALFVRGTPTPVGSQYRWNSGYRFAITDHSYSIGYHYGGEFYWLTDGWIPWTSSTTWNTLKVTGNGNFMQFYINGTRVAYGTFGSIYSTGKVGIAFYSDGSSGDSVYVDWATLNSVAPSSIVLGPTDNALFLDASNAKILDLDPNQNPISVK
ncbi:MAG: hypothetical protein AB2L18_09415 [Anaerolineaceae bacterium]